MYNMIISDQNLVVAKYNIFSHWIKD